MPGTIFVLTGPSGVGKTTVVKELLKRVPRLVRLVTYTTRPPRPGEVPDIDYHFISHDEFARMRESDAFFEYAQVYNAWYGNAKSDLQRLLAMGSDVLFVTDIQGAKTIEQKLPEAISIFLQAESAESLVRRLKGRGKITLDDEKTRSARAQHEMAEAHTCDHVVTAYEGKVEETVQAVIRIIEDGSQV